MPYPRCVVLLHVYYPELWEEIAGYLHNLHGTGFDLCVNAVEGRTTAEWREGVFREFPGARVFVSPNLGQDIGGTVSLLRHVDLSRYDLVCKIHTKRSTYDPAKGVRWRHDLLRACLEDPLEIFDIFARRAEVTMLGSASWAMVGNGMNQRACERLCDRLKVDRRWAYGSWIAGSMFWCRPYVMQALKDAKISQDEFVFAYGHDGTLAHAIERVFGALAATRGEIYWRPSRRGIGKAEPAARHPGRRLAKPESVAQRVNWFFCLNDHELRFAQCARVAVMSAAPYPLNKFCIYDGQDEHLVKWLTEHGVRVIRHRFSLAGELLELLADRPEVGLGAYLRTDIPELARVHNLLDGSHYLYTDCDVMFENDPSWLQDLPTDTFCAGIELHESESHFNTGVMWCNAGFFDRSLDEFRRFLVAKRFDFSAFDQGALNEFYGPSRKVLGREYNWKPHWGVDENAVVVHFHGPKPWDFRLWQHDPAEFNRRQPSLEPFLKPHTEAAYEHYVARFEEYLARAEGRPTAAAVS